MTNRIISVEGLSKSYTITHQSLGNGRTSGYRRLSEDLLSYPRRLLSRFTTLYSSNVSSEEFFALSDVAFEVKEGETVGIIGRNGAGKSTLLKILSRITEPTRGRVTLRGRVASLLEVGTGFHPELTGRENIFLNGAILGMSRAEIRRKFDEIVEFAGVEKFLDTPVKRYSSGMYVRLAFAVASSLEPEILVVDEVLAVGDAEFQRKCLGKMQEVGSSGRTVLLVSHNMGSILSLCGRAILLEKGKIAADGEASSVIQQHLNGSRDNSSIGFRNVGNSEARLLDAWAERSDAGRAVSFGLDEPIRVVMEYQLLRDFRRAPYPNFHIFNENGQHAFVTSDCNANAKQPGVYRAACVIPPNLLNDGPYFVGVALTSTCNGIDVCFFERDAVHLNLVETLSDDPFGPPRFGYAGPIPGAVRPKLNWEIELCSHMV